MGHPVWASERSLLPLSRKAFRRPTTVDQRLDIAMACCQQDNWHR
ncbi:MAG: hypothetical protein AAGG53_05590 [Cyanobacteria bacterium P01_H01_bin.152]